jgi:hypothetical protein
MKTLSSVLLLCVTLFGLSAHAGHADCPLKNLRKSGLLLNDQSTNPYTQILAQRGNANSSSAGTINSSN